MQACRPQSHNLRVRSHSTIYTPCVRTRSSRPEHVDHHHNHHQNSSITEPQLFHLSIHNHLVCKDKRACKMQKAIVINRNIVISFKPTSPTTPSATPFNSLNGNKETSSQGQEYPSQPQPPHHVHDPTSSSAPDYFPHSNSPHCYY